MPDDTPARREVLQSADARLAAVAATEQVAAGAFDDAYIVGTKSDRGSDAAKQRATPVIYEFDFGDIEQVVAGRFPGGGPGGAAEELEGPVRQGLVGHHRCLGGRLHARRDCD